MISVHDRNLAGELGTLSAFRRDFYGCTHLRRKRERAAFGWEKPRGRGRR